MSEGFPIAVEAPDHAVIGMQRLDELGLNPTEVGSIQLFAGGVCQGTLAEFMGMEKHAPITDEIIKTVNNARDNGEDPAAAVVNSLGLFVRRDEQGAPIRAGAEELKKN